MTLRCEECIFYGLCEESTELQYCENWAPANMEDYCEREANYHQRIYTQHYLDTIEED